MAQHSGDTIREMQACIRGTQFEAEMSSSEKSRSVFLAFYKIFHTNYQALEALKSGVFRFKHSQGMTLRDIARIMQGERDRNEKSPTYFAETNNFRKLPHCWNKTLSDDLSLNLFIEDDKIVVSQMVDHSAGKVIHANTQASLNDVKSLLRYFGQNRKDENAKAAN